MKRIVPLFLALILSMQVTACAASGNQRPEGAEQAHTVDSGGFTDIPNGADYTEAVAWCREQGLIQGISATVFAPDDPLTRAMLATILYRAAGEPEVSGVPAFTDVRAGTWYSAAVVWANDTGIVRGYGNGFFGTNDPVTLEQLDVILRRYMGEEPTWTGDPTLAVSATRAQVAVALYTFLADSKDVTGPSKEDAAVTKINIKIGSQTFTATLADTEAAQAWVECLPMTVTMSELNGNEKYYYMDDSLPTAAQNPGAIEAGDLMLYGNNCLVLFYKSFSTSYSYTALGHIDDPEGLAQAVGAGNVQVSLFLAEEETAPTTGKTLVAYFSATNTTKPLAEYAADILGADLYEIVPQEPYTEADLAYYTGGRADREQNDPAVRPAISGRVMDMAQYDVVLIGYPIWHGQAPRIISTFLESYDFSGKTVVPFCTSHSSGIGSSDTNLYALTDGAHWLSGRRFPGGTSRSTIEDWINSLDLPKTEPVQSPVFDFETKTVKLNSGYTMPINGLGTYSLHGDTCVNAVKSALADGVRLIDTAHMYGNEEEIGRAIRESIEELGIRREEIFVITKIYPGSDMADPEAAIQTCLDRLDIGYVDMMLLHHPDPNDVKAYKAMETFVEAGKIRSIGLSNWYVEELESFLPQVDTVPALVQNEIHPYYQENDVIPYIQSLGIVVQGWYPLGGRGHTAELLGDQTISAIAQAHGVSSAQVILRWNLQKGVVVIPGSSNPEHIRENTALYHFELTGDEMAQLNALDRGEKHDWY